MLTKKQKTVLDFIKQYSNKRGYAPSLEEIQKHFKLASVSTAHFHVSRLRDAGYLAKEESKPRSIDVLKQQTMSTIPLLGTIAAGEPIEAIENSENISVSDSQLSKSGKHFALKVKGDSMIEDGIFADDIVVIRKQPNANDGETVVALINDDEVTLKKIFREKNRFRLQPANKNLKPIFVRNLTIQGKVVSIIRNFERPNINNGEFIENTINYVQNSDLNYRKSLGQYFTPKSIRDMLLNKLPNSIVKPKVLDPACGTGEFLITAKDYFKSPKLFGWDIDKKLVSISKRVAPEADLKSLDSLMNEDYGRFDFVIGNPPYFEFNPSVQIRNKFKEVINGRINIFSLFIYQGLRWLKEGGYLAYVIPPSMNNGAYFKKLREFIIDNSNIESLEILRDPKLFDGALQSTMLLVLKKGKNQGDYLFQKNGITIFTEGVKYLEKIFKGRVTLKDVGYSVKTGSIVWNQNRNLLTHNPNVAIPLIWAYNVGNGELKLPINKPGKPQYIKTTRYDVGPAIVVNRITGSVGSTRLRAALIPRGMKFLAENHVNVIYPPSRNGQEQLNLGKLGGLSIHIEDVAKQLSSEEKIDAIKNITGNTQISKNELEKLFPLDL